MQGQIDMDGQGAPHGPNWAGSFLRETVYLGHVTRTSYP